MQRAVYRRKWLEGHSANHDLEVRAFIQWFRCVICEMRNWKTPLDRHLKCAFQITHRDVIWRTHGQKYRLSNFNSKCAFRIKIQNTHFAVVWKQSKRILNEILDLHVTGNQCSCCKTGVIGEYFLCSRQWESWPYPVQGSSSIRRQLDVASSPTKNRGWMNLYLIYFWPQWICTVPLCGVWWIFT